MASPAYPSPIKTGLGRTQCGCHGAAAAERTVFPRRFPPPRLGLAHWASRPKPQRRLRVPQQLCERPRQPQNVERIVTGSGPRSTIRTTHHLATWPRSEPDMPLSHVPRERPERGVEIATANHKR